MKANYKIVFSKKASKEIKSFSNQLIKKIIKASESLSVNPRPSGSTK